MAGPGGPGPDPALADYLQRELVTPTMAEAHAFAAHLAERQGVAAVLFYGSCLQRGTTEGMLDFYALTDGGGAFGESAIIAAAGRALPPNVYPVEFAGLKAKVAVVPIDRFREKMALSSLDTTFWARFCQRAALVWRRDAAAERAAVEAVATGVETAAVWASRLAPDAEGPDAWRTLFSRTYRVEIRPERANRGPAVVDADETRFAEVWPLTAPARANAPDPAPGAWTVRWLAGKALHIARLTKAAFTYEGGARYLLWKIRRHRRR